MSCAENVKLTFINIREPAQATLLAYIGKCLTATGDYLVGISLMTDVKNYPVPRCIIDIMQTNNQFHGPQTGGKMTGVARTAIYHIVANLRA